MKTATDDAVLKAYSQAVKKLENDNRLTATEVSAGFIIPNGQKRGKKTGFQVFVKVHRFSEELLKKDKTTGGLL